MRKRRVIIGQKTVCFVDVSPCGTFTKQKQMEGLSSFTITRFHGDPPPFTISTLRLPRVLIFQTTPYELWHKEHSDDKIQDLRSILLCNHDSWT